MSSYNRNPFGDSSDRPQQGNNLSRGASGGGRMSARQSQSISQQQQKMAGASTGGGGGPNNTGMLAGEPPIWAARNVEWPIPSALSVAQYNKLWKASRHAAQQSGMKDTPGGMMSHHQAAGGSGSNAVSGSSADNYSSDAPHPGDASDGGDAKYGSYAGGLVSGFMSRVLNTSATSDKADDHDAGLMGDGLSSSSSAQRPLRPPRPGCVAASNGWIVAVLECPHPAQAGAPDGCLRLVSRWNVRRGGGLADPWMALPPPSHGDGKMAHVFVDPTGSHILMSAYNGEAYYLHASQKVPLKLQGFGDAMLASLTLTGISASMAVAAAASSGSAHAASSIQQGLSPNTYVTGVAWDKERGTEGSTKRILLGTSGGEIYEYSLQSPNADAPDPECGPAGNSTLPVLLHKLHSSGSIGGGGAGGGDAGTDASAPVTGIYLERLRTGLLLLVATSGRHKRTRFCTFYSPHGTNLSLLFQPPSQAQKSSRSHPGQQQHSTLMELPGSVDFADLRVCNDSFGLRTCTGIYYGKMDRNYTAVSGSNVVVESGILPYEVPANSTSYQAAAFTPISLAVTPHHIITLSESNELRFVNRVAHKVIQRERVDAVTAEDSAGLAPSSLGNQASLGELLMDIRRPDQVWLRKGRALVHISSSQEDRDVWKFTLQKCLDMPVAGAPATSRHGGARTLVASPVASAPPLTDEEKAVEALFEQAKTLCSNSHQKAVVTAIRAEYHLQHGRAELAAKYLAQCPPQLEPFSDAAVRLALPKLGVDARDQLSPAARTSLEASNLPLIAYLSDKMRVGAMNDDKMASTMIGAWLTELYLHERGERVSSAAALGDSSPVGVDDVEAAHRVMLARFLNSHVNHMDAKTIMKILTSHDVGAGECAVYAARSGDISTAVNAALSVRGDDASGAFEALQILDDTPFELAEPLYYRHAPILLARAPAAARESFVNRYAQGLSPLRLLPSIMHYENSRNERLRRRKGSDAAPRGASGGTEESKVVELRVDAPKGSRDGFELQVRESLQTSSFVDDPDVAISYLEGVIKQGCRSSAVYRYLLSLYAKLEDEEPLYGFLSTHVPAAEVASLASTQGALSASNWNAASQQGEISHPLDMSYALRTVLSTGRHFRSAIKLYMGFGMRQHAVELALKVDPTLARALAQESVELEERKRLWLMIAKNAASDGSALGGKDVVSKVVSVLKDCGPEVLSIEDVLPFLPDFAQIDQIKDEICEALTSYSSKIESFLKEMSECDQMCDRLRDEISRLRNHRMRMKGDARCAFTGRLVLEAGEPFYIFPSGYVVLASALKNQVLPFLNHRQRARVAELETLLSAGGGADSSREEIQTELDGLIAAECPLTGTIMADSIDLEFEGCAEIDEAGGLLRSFVERVEV